MRYFELAGSVVAEVECLDEEECLLEPEGDCFFCDLEDV